MYGNYKMHLINMWNKTIIGEDEIGTQNQVHWLWFIRKKAYHENQPTQI